MEREPKPTKLEGVKRLIGQAEDGFLRLIFGPETRGEVLAIRTDREIPDYTHVLIRTDKGETEKFVIRSEDLFSGDRQTLRVGEEFAIRTRDPDLLTPIGSGSPTLEEDPFFIK